MEKAQTRSIAVPGKPGRTDGGGIEYRREGKERWQTVKVTDGQTEAFLPEAEAGTVYEVRAHAKVDGVTSLIEMPSLFYGEYSDPVTVHVP